MKVLHLAHVRWYNAEAQYALDLAGEMVRQGHQVGLLGQTGSPVLDRARERGLEVFEEAGFNAKGLRSAAAVAAARRLRGLVRARGFEAVEVHRSEGLPLVAWACRREGVPAVRVRGDMRPVRADPLNRWVYRRLLSGTVASNRTIEASLRARLGSALRVTTIHGGVDPGEFSPDGPSVDLRRELGFEGGTFLVGILGRLGKVKGHEIFLAAAREALASGAPAGFVILAKEPTAREAELRAAVEGDPVLCGRVGFVGHRRDLPAVLRAFDLGVVASTGSEANCRVGLEWMASGVPLLATRVGVLPDLVREEGNGYLVSPGDPFSLAEKIVYLARHPGEARSLGRGARGTVLEQFTLERCARAHAALLQETRRDHPS